MSRSPDTRRNVEDSKVLILIIDCCNRNSSGGVVMETWKSRVPIDVIVISIVSVPDLILFVVSIFIAFYLEGLAWGSSMCFPSKSMLWLSLLSFKSKVLSA